MRGTTVGQSNRRYQNTSHHVSVSAPQHTYCRSTSLAPSVTWLFLLYPPPFTSQLMNSLRYRMGGEPLARESVPYALHAHGRRFLSFVPLRSSVRQYAAASMAARGMDEIGRAECHHRVPPRINLFVPRRQVLPLTLKIGMICLQSRRVLLKRSLCEYHELSRTLQTVVAPYARS